MFDGLDAFAELPVEMTSKNGVDDFAQLPAVQFGRLPSPLAEVAKDLVQGLRQFVA
jgi:hypothetical protein